MTRLYVVEQSGLEPGGHYHAYTSCVVAGARQLGLDAVVLANKRLRAAGGTLPSDTIACFTYTWAEAELDGKLGWEQGNIAYELFEAFRRLPPTPDDHVFLHTTGYRELLALLRCLTGKLPGDPLPSFHLLLRRDPDVLIDSYDEFADCFERIAASPYLQQKIKLHADTHLLSAAFARICRLPFATAPIPFDQELLRAALAARPPRRAGEPLTVVYLGDAREEKGYQHLPQALAFLWQDYVAPGRVRFVLQSNFNTPGGEPGILSASQNLAAFPATTLKTDPLQAEEYYRLLAEADIVLIPYSAQRYRYRSSGVLIEAMGAGKPVVTSAGSWMATQVDADHAVLFDSPAGLGPAIADAIERFEPLSRGAEARREATLANATGASLVRHLLATAPPPARRPAPRRRVLFVMNGDAMVLHNGASRVAQAQLDYLEAAGHDVVGLFLSYGVPQDGDALAAWRAAFGRAIAPFRFERVFVCGPSSRPLDPDHMPGVRDQRQQSGAPLKAEFEFVAGFEFDGTLLRYLRSHAVGAVLLNYITSFPIIDALGLDGVPVICEMHDLQAFQRAIYGQRLVDPADLDEEFEWLARCAGLLSLNPRETAIVRARLPEALVETTGVFLRPPPQALASLAGAKDLAEVVSSTRPVKREYQFETAWEIGEVDAVQRLIDLASIDLFYVSSAHVSNVSGLKWFLSQVYEPHLAQRQLSIVVAGSICRIDDWPQHPRMFFIDQVEDLAPLYAAARVVVLPITEGAGSPIKTYEALAYGRPVVGTSHAFRGIDAGPDEFIIRDDPADFAAAILDLIDSPQRRRGAAERARRTAARCNDFARYFGVMDRVFAAVLGEAVAPTPPPPAEAREPNVIEWSASLRATNRLLRSYLGGEPFERWAVDELASQPQQDSDRLLEAIGDSLFERRDASVLRTERRINRQLVAAFDSRLREEAMFAVRLALAERAGRRPPAGPSADKALRAVVYGGLSLTIAGTGSAEGGAAMTVTTDGRALAMRPVSDARRPGGRAALFHAELPAVPGERVGLRTVELSLKGAEPPNRIAVLRQSIPLLPNLHVLEREVFDGGFELRSGGEGADLPPGASGLLWLPRMADGRSPAYIDLCLAPASGGVYDPLAPPRAVTALSVLIDNRPVDTEAIGTGPLTLIRVVVDAGREHGDFGTVPLTIVNKSSSTALRLIAVYTGLLAGPAPQAAGIATVLALAEQRLESAGNPRLTGLAREAIAMIIAGDPPGGQALDALCAVSAQPAGQELRALAVQELSRASRQAAGTRPVTGDTAAVLDDIYSVIATRLGTDDATTAILCPGLPFEIVDIAGAPLAERTEAALQQRGGSWRVSLPADAAGDRIKVELDATLEVPGHPGIVGFTNFHPIESPEALYRWTGPEPTSTIIVPVALNRPARLAIALGTTGKNTDSADFAITCNGKTVAHTAAFDEHGAMLTADLPPLRLAGPTVEIGLTVKHCFQQPPDRRVLGVVFRSLTLLLAGAQRSGSAARLHADGVRRVGEAPPVPVLETTPAGETVVELPTAAERSRGGRKGRAVRAKPQTSGTAAVPGGDGF